MKKRIFIIILIGLALIITLFLGISKSEANSAGPLTAYWMNVVKGCSIIKDCPSYAKLTEDDRDKIILEYGYRLRGINKTSLSDYCRQKNPEDDGYIICSPSGYQVELYSVCH